MPYRTTPKLSEALVTYERIRAASCAKSTIQNDHSVINRFIQGVGDPEVHKLTSAACEDWFAGEAERQLPTSYNKVRARILLFLAFCTRRGWLTTDPMIEVGKRRTQAPRRRLQLTRHQLVEVIETCPNPRDRGMLACAANTGLRASDLCKLTVGDVDLDQGLISVIIQKTRDTDQLPITADLDVELRRWLTWYADRLTALDMSLTPSMLMFPALGHNNVTRRGRFETYGDPQPNKILRHPARVVQRALPRIGIEAIKDEGFHTIRRSVGRLVFDTAADQGHDGALRLTAALLGHRSVATTELYLGVNRDRAKRDDLLKGRSLLGAPAVDNVRAIGDAV